MHDCIIIGAGHNGLTAANYLARAGKKVLVLERRDKVGGAAVTGEIAPGYRISTASYLMSLLLPEVERDLELGKHGYKVLPRNPSSFTPFEARVRMLLSEFPEMPATVLAERVGWAGSPSWFRENVARLRPEQRRPDPADRPRGGWLARSASRTRPR